MAVAATGTSAVDDERYDHPLASEAAAELFSSSGLSAEDFLASVEFGTRLELQDDGTTVSVHFVEFPDTEAFTTTEKVVESEPNQDPQVGARLQAWLERAQTSDKADVRLRLASTEWERGPDPVFARWVGLLDGSILTVSDEREVRGEAVRARRAAGEEGLASIIADIEAGGGEADPANGIYLTLNPWGGATSDNLCQGRSSWSASFNGMYESGVAMMKSAGNGDWLAPADEDGDGLANDNTNDCSVSEPGAAIGVFPVGAFNGNGGTESLDKDQSRGGTATQGQGRTIIGVSSPTSFYFPYPHYDRPPAAETKGPPYNVLVGDPYFYGADFGDGPRTLADTSGAVPTAVGAANVFAQWYRSVHGYQIDDPGILYTNLLLMGDRTTQTGTLATSGYDNLWGAGKLRLRRFDGVGLDDPGLWGDASLCIASGQATNISIYTQMPAGVDVIKATMWWYDRRHQDGIDPSSDGIFHDEMTLKLQHETTPGTWVTDVTDATTDNKKRVYLNGLGSATKWRLRIEANDITADDEGCGTNAMRVYYAFFFEDSAREISVNLWSVRVE